MDEFKIIDVMNEAMLKLLKDRNKDFQENLKISEYLKDEAIFFKINKQNAYSILKNVGVKEEQLENVYKKLTSPNVFYKLLNSGKIKENDELIIKYETYRKQLIRMPKEFAKLRSSKDVAKKSDEIIAMVKQYKKCIDELFAIYDEFMEDIYPKLNA